jgi:DNA-binding XRE family transcriptional regulator
LGLFVSPGVKAWAREIAYKKSEQDKFVLSLHIKKSEQDELDLMRQDMEGNYPAAKALRVILAQKFLKRRLAAGLTEVKLASLAGIRPETLNRLEQGKHTPSVETINKIDKALARVEMHGK